MYQSRLTRVFRARPDAVDGGAGVDKRRFAEVQQGRLPTPAWTAGGTGCPHRPQRQVPAPEFYLGSETTGCGVEQCAAPLGLIYFHTLGPVVAPWTRVDI